MKPDIWRFETLKECSLAAADFITDQATAAVRDTGMFSLALAGGSTPRLLYECLGSPAYASRLPWGGIHLFWGDERCVKKTDPDSNYAMAYDSLIKKVDIAAANIHRIPAEIEPPSRAAQAYAETVRQVFHQKAGLPLARTPAFDLVLLGMGPDGHTASLFPGNPALHEKKELVTAVVAPTASPPLPRISLTYALINEAKCVFFLVAGRRKNQIVQEIIDDRTGAAQKYPAALVWPQGRLIWAVAEND